MHPDKIMKISAIVLQNSILEIRNVQNLTNNANPDKMTCAVAVQEEILLERIHDALASLAIRVRKKGEEVTSD